MKLTAFTDYSLRVLIYLAAEPDRRATIAEISEAFDIKANHLTKVVHHLQERLGGNGPRQGRRTHTCHEGRGHRCRKGSP